MAATTSDQPHRAAASGPRSRLPLQRRLWRTAGWLAIAHVVLLFAGAGLTTSLQLGDPAGTARQRVGDVVAGDEHGRRVPHLPRVPRAPRSTACSSPGCSRGTDELTGWLSSCIGGTTVAWVATTVAAGLAAGAAAVYDGHHGASLEALTTVNDVRNVAFILTGGLAGVFLVAVAVAGRRTRLLSRPLTLDRRHPRRRVDRGGSRRPRRAHHGDDDGVVRVVRLVRRSARCARRAAGDPCPGCAIMSAVTTVTATNDGGCRDRGSHRRGHRRRRRGSAGSRPWSTGRSSGRSATAACSRCSRSSARWSSRPGRRTGWAGRCSPGARWPPLGGASVALARHGMVHHAESAAAVAVFAIGGQALQGLGWLGVTLVGPAFFPDLERDRAALDQHGAGRHRRRCRVRSAPRRPRRPPRRRHLAQPRRDDRTRAAASPPSRSSPTSRSRSWSPPPSSCSCGVAGAPATSVRREQIRLFAIAAALPIVAAPVALATSWGSWIFAVAALPLPIAIGVAVLARGLYDLRNAVNRTLVWLTLSALVAGLYALVIGGAATLGHVDRRGRLAAVGRRDRARPVGRPAARRPATGRQPHHLRTLGRALRGARRARPAPRGLR